MTAGRRCPGFGSAGRKSWAWIDRPSVAEKITVSGTTSEAVGKSAGMAPGARSWSGPPPTRMAGEGCFFGPALTNAMVLPSPVATGDHSRPAPEVSATGLPPATATRQRWRRSMSSWFEL